MFLSDNAHTVRESPPSVLLGTIEILLFSRCVALEIARHKRRGSFLKNYEVAQTGSRLVICYVAIPLGNTGAAPPSWTGFRPEPPFDPRPMNDRRSAGSGPSGRLGVEGPLSIPSKAIIRPKAEVG